MTRSILAALTVAVAIVVLSGTGCQSTGVGDPCVTEQEYDPTFLGYDYHEVGVEPASFQCLTRLCLANHFQGRVTCPYGQDVNGNGNPPATQGCVTPGLHLPVQGLVQPQCLGRTASLAAYCSCRCANLDGTTTDGANYCTCPDGFQCAPLITSLGAATDVQLVGSYCIKSGTAYSASASTGSDEACAGMCGDGNATNCGNPDNTGGS